MPVTEDSLVDAQAHAMASAHSRFCSLFNKSHERTLSMDEYRWLVVAAMREYRKRTLKV